MFIIRWLRWLFGWVSWEAEGGFYERLMNLAAHDHLFLWGVRYREGRLHACCLARDYARLRGPARRTGTRIRLTARHGFPFWARRYRCRTGLIVGACAFALIVHLLSQRTWIVLVRGNEQVDTQKILSVMADLGVREGKDLSLLDINDIQLESLQRLPELAWCTVNLRGSVAYIDVDEGTPRPDLYSDGTISNIKAKCDGRVLSVEAHTGRAMVQRGDAVVEGMLLISGVIDSPSGTLLRRARGRVIAETTHCTVIDVPFSERVRSPGDVHTDRAYLQVFSLRIPLFTDGRIDPTAQLTEAEHRLTANHMTLPLGWYVQRYTPWQEVLIERTPAEAEQEAARRLAAWEEKLAGIEIVSRTVEGQPLEEGYELTATYVCREDIGVEVALVS